MDKHFDFLMAELLDNALDEFQETEEYALWKEKLAQMDQDCETMLTEQEKTFVQECFGMLLDAEARKTQHVYHKGLLDGVQLLKQLGVLA